MIHGCQNLELRSNGREGVCVRAREKEVVRLEGVCVRERESSG